MSAAPTKRVFPGMPPAAAGSPCLPWGYICFRLDPQPTSGIARSTGDSLESFTVAKSRALRSSLAAQAWSNARSASKPSTAASWRSRRAATASTPRVWHRWPAPSAPPQHDGVRSRPVPIAARYRGWIQ